jgi:hypothetical protein
MMDEELLEKLKVLENEIQKIKEEYGQFRDYKLISTILDKVGVTYVELNYDEINTNDSVYILEHDHKHHKVILRKEENN